MHSKRLVLRTLSQLPQCSLVVQLGTHDAFRIQPLRVETFKIPVPISVGPLGDDIGMGNMTAEQQKKVMDLFNKRKQERMEISWIEEDPWNPKYQGKEVKFKWNL